MDLVVLSGRIVVQVVVETGGPGDGTLLPLVAVGENDTMLIVIIVLSLGFAENGLNGVLLVAGAQLVALNTVLAEIGI